MDKREKRHHFLLLRSSISSLDKLKAEDTITELLKRDPDLIQARCIAGYAAIRKELSISEYLHWALGDGKRVFLPRCNGKEYEMVEIFNMNQDLVEGHYSIMEPKPELPALSDESIDSEIHAWIVPGVAFTEKGDRLGMGKGIYDRLMARTEAPKIGVGYECQRAQDLPVRPWDITLTKVYFV